MTLEQLMAANPPCQEYGPGLFFSENYREIEQAKRICMTECPVQRECLLYALTQPERFGVWGGMAERKRRLSRGRLLRTLV